MRTVAPESLRAPASDVSVRAFALAKDVALGRTSRARAATEAARLRAVVERLQADMAHVPADERARAQTREIGFALSEATLDLDYVEAETSVTSLRLSTIVAHLR